MCPVSGTLGAAPASAAASTDNGLLDKVWVYPYVEAEVSPVMQSEVGTDTEK